jgi:aspartate racemase
LNIANIYKKRQLQASQAHRAAATRGLECVRPEDRQRDEAGRISMEELVRGVFRPESIAYLQSVILTFRERSCDAVILGCTEIPLVIDDANSSLPALDSTRLLARAALRRAATDGRSASLA